MSGMPFVFDDGGRAEAGFKGTAGDCVVRSIAIAAGLSYREVYDAVSEGCRSERVTRRAPRRVSGRDGVRVGRKWFKDYLVALGWLWTPTMLVGHGCRVHLVAEELPLGRLIVSLSRHYTAVIDRVIHDTFDPQRGATVYYVPGAGGSVIDHVSPDRCGYGYWSRGIAVAIKGDGTARTRANRST